MRIFFLVLLLFISSTSVILADLNLSLQGTVKSEITKQDLTDAYVIFLDKDGNPKDSVRANKGFRYRDGHIDTLSNFAYHVPRVDSTYVFDVVCNGFETLRTSYTVNKIGKRETTREIPVIYLKKAARQLDEVTVTATKVKFYNKGDTIVYDASAFQLSEGSMLDALIAQLPGVELNDDGQIKVNGQFVESLLLDGKKFFDGNNNLMLENIAAYTVKNIQVYEGVSQEDKFMGKDYNKVLTMDVRLKKEYNVGWLLNVQGGYGTENRYLGRLFATWFDPEWRVAIIGNGNNLNDNRYPGRNDTWTPEKMPSGRQRNLSAGLQYNFETPDSKKMANGDFFFNQTCSEKEVRTDRTNFFNEGDTYEKSFRNSNDRDTRINTSHWMMFSNNNLGVGGRFFGNYESRRNSNTNLSGAFTENQDSISYPLLDMIYSIGNIDLLETIINRSKTQTDGWTKKYEIMATPGIKLKIPKTSDELFFNLNFRYSSDKNEVWKDYDINYGPTYNNPERLRQYFDNTPNHSLDLGAGLAYSLNISNFGRLFLQYDYLYSDIVKDSYMYALDRLTDMGIYGTLPSGYLTVFDPNNSYKSRMFTNQHSLSPSFHFIKPFNNQSILFVILQPSLKLIHRKFNYWRNEMDYRLSRTNLSLNLQSRYSARIEYKFRKHGEDMNSNYTNTLTYTYQMNSKLPDMFDMVEVVNDSDPLNIYYGNPNLKQQISHDFNLSWKWDPRRWTFDNTINLSYRFTKNALTRGYTYDMSTGVRYNMMYNVAGNNTFSLLDELKWQFGTSKQFTLSSATRAEWSQYSDMIGVNMELPSLNKVKNRLLSQNLYISWRIGKANIGVRCDVTNRYTTSQQQGFTKLNATHVTSGINAQINLPAGFGANTDFMFYTRRGYGVEYLDTTDPVWNIRISYCPPKYSKWVFMIDGFDMLHTLSNVSYAVNAAGRTVSYTNVLPRYFLFSIQYRLNIQPKKK